MLKDFFKRFKECVGTTVWLPPSLFYHVLQNDTKSQKILSTEGYQRSCGKHLDKCEMCVKFTSIVSCLAICTSVCACLRVLFPHKTV